MSCEDIITDQCVCDVVREIARTQNHVTRRQDEGCEGALNDLINNSFTILNTIPLLFVCKGCDYYIASGIFRAPNTTTFNCFQTAVFRVDRVFDDTCCAKIELLQPQTALGTVPPLTMEDGVCRFFPVNTIQKFIRTGVFVTIDLKCFCGVQCLPAVFAEPGTPQVPPESCTNPILTLNVDDFTCAGEVTGTITCNGNPVANVPVILSNDGNVVVSFTPNPTTTNAQGIFSAIATVPAGTKSTAVTITAQAIVNGVLVSDSEPITVSCPETPGGPCDGCGILISKGPSITTATVVSNGGSPTLIPGTINILINECNNCGNSDNFNFQFSGTGIFQGLTLNFNQGRRTVIDCNPLTQSAVITGVIRVQGNNPFFDNGQVFDVTINVTGPNPGTFVINATSGTDSFSATFTGTAGGTFTIEDCSA